MLISHTWSSIVGLMLQFVKIVMPFLLSTDEYVEFEEMLTRIDMNNPPIKNPDDVLDIVF